MTAGWLLFFFIIVGIPLITIFSFAAFMQHMRHKEKMAEKLNAQAAEKAAQYAANGERLEQRVRVLERIATDKGIDLADEIDRLRDAPLN